MKKTFEWFIQLTPERISFGLDIQTLCRRSYPGHPHGCPNWNRKRGCPPGAPLINGVLDFNHPVFLVVTEFNLKTHALNMKTKHPNWSERQVYCCLYWQPAARKVHRQNVVTQMREHSLSKWVAAPEAHGVNVTRLLRDHGIELEWPPRDRVRIVSLLGFPVKG